MCSLRIAFPVLRVSDCATIFRCALFDWATLGVAAKVGCAVGGPVDFGRIKQLG